MKRREFIKSAIIGAMAASVPLVAASKESAGVWRDLSGVSDRLLRVGDITHIRVTPTITAKSISENMMQLMSPYKEFMITDIDYEAQMIKVLPYEA